MTEDEIGELVKLVSRWNGTGVGVGQGNGDGISSMNRKPDDRVLDIDWLVHSLGHSRTPQYHMICPRKFLSATAPSILRLFIIKCATSIHG